MRWNARKTQGGVAVAAVEKAAEKAKLAKVAGGEDVPGLRKHGDTYFGTPNGQQLRSLKGAERWLGLAATPPAVSASNSASSSASTSASTSTVAKATSVAKATKAAQAAKPAPDKAAAARLRERTSAALLGTLADYS